MAQRRGDTAETAPGDAADLAGTLYALMGVGIRHRPRDISLTSASTLATLRRSGPRRVTDLAALEGVTQPSMSALVTSLEALGMVARHRDEGDGRVALVSLTAAGEKYLARRRAAGADIYARLVDKLSPEDTRSLVAVLPALSRLLDLDGDRDPKPHEGQPQADEAKAEAR